VPQQAYDEKHWITNYPGALECARCYKGLLERLYGTIQTKYFESYISLSVGGTARVWISKRKGDRAFIEVKYGQENLQEAIDYLNEQGVAFNVKDAKYITFNVNGQQLREKISAHEWLTTKVAPNNITSA